MQSYDVLVRGGGAVGLACALSLGRLNLRVALRREAAAATDDLRAYALNAASVRLLQRLRAWDAIPADARTPVHDMHVEGDVPGAALDFSAWWSGAAALAWIVDAAELDRALRAATAFAQHVDDVAADVPATLEVLAEGRDSATRDRLGIAVERRPYGQRAIAARLVADVPHAGLARQWFLSPSVLALLPIDRPEPGRSLALVWSLPDAEADTLAALPDADFDAALMAATGGAAGTLRLVSRRAQWPLMLARAQRVHGTGHVLVGDAAHVVHPLAGQGLNLGLADVAALADVIAAREPWRSIGDAKLLARYARARIAPTWAMARVTDTLLRLFAAQSPWVKEIRNRGLTLVNHASPVKRALTARATGD